MVFNGVSVKFWTSCVVVKWTQTTISPEWLSGIEEREGGVDLIDAIVCHLNYKITISKKVIFSFSWSNYNKCTILIGPKNLINSVDF